MEEELNLDLDENNNEEVINRKDSRIKSLSDKVKSTAQERDELAKAKAEAEAKAEALQKEADFFKNFNAVSSKYQGAIEYQDKIREKVALGLDVEDATMLVMTKEGKYTPPQPEQPLAAGGSAAIGIHDNMDKGAKDMSQTERRALLEEAFSKGEFKL